jgi:hypothetical protein
MYAGRVRARTQRPGAAARVTPARSPALAGSWCLRSTLAAVAFRYATLLLLFMYLTTVVFTFVHVPAQEVLLVHELEQLIEASNQAAFDCIVSDFYCVN